MSRENILERRFALGALAYADCCDDLPARDANLDHAAENIANVFPLVRI